MINFKTLLNVKQLNKNDVDVIKLYDRIYKLYDKYDNVVKNNFYKANKQVFIKNLNKKIKQIERMLSFKVY